MAFDLFSLSGRIALVTGGSRGIGLMIAQDLIEAGAEKIDITSRAAHWVVGDTLIVDGGAVMAKYFHPDPLT